MKPLIAALAALTLTVGAVAATTASAQAPAAATIPAAKGALSVETTTIADLIADPGAHAVLAKDLPKLLAYDGLEQIKGLTLRGISVYPQAELDDAKLAAIQKDLDAAAKH
jgi:hypothetical protein